MLPPREQESAPRRTSLLLRTTSIRAAKRLLARLVHRQSVGALTGRAAFPLMASALAIACQGHSAYPFAECCNARYAAAVDS